MFQREILINNPYKGKLQTLKKGKLQTQLKNVLDVILHHYALT